jgi:hypothetical protein
MHKILFVLILLWSSVAAAEVVNMEFKFTPYVGDPIKSDKVETVAGNAKVFINNVLFAEQEVREDKVPVMFEEREIAASVWIVAKSLGPVLRKGKNSLRIQFDPTNVDKQYNARLYWVSVTDQVTEKNEGGKYQATNQANEGREDKKTKGSVVLQKEFVVDFATDLPWHHYPAVTAISDEDKKSMTLLVEKRSKAFKPQFAEIYKILATKPELKLDELKKTKCLDKAYAAGIRFEAPIQNQLDFTMTGNPEVVISRKGSAPLYSFDEKSFLRIKNEDMQMCAAMALWVAFPPRLVVVKSPSGVWEIVY